MKKLVFIAGHLGYPMDRTPLGGGAMVGVELARQWRAAGVELAVLGSGPETPAPGVEYHALAEPGQDGLVSLSEFGYAAFCRRFERETTRWLLNARARFDPSQTCVVVNDISEGPALAELSRAGYPIVSIWHVDVVDYFNKLYLRRYLKPERLTRLYEFCRSLGLSKAVPDVLRLVFEKQRETVANSRRLVVPSQAMAETLRRCYGGLLGDAEELARRIVVVPWGGWDPRADEAEVASGAERLKAHYQIGPNTTTLMTLSRISPEKGIHLLLEALRLLEVEGFTTGRDVCLFVCGEPAFMQGAAYERVVRRAAAALKRVRVFFPGYLAAAEKQMHFRLARLFVSPSLHESYGLTVVEAMRAGLAVLASDHYGVQDLLHESFGRRVHYSSARQAPPLLAAELEELLAEPERLKEMGRLARLAGEAMPFQKAAQAVLETAFSLIPEKRQEVPAA